MTTDIHFQSWLLRKSPLWLEPYLRLMRLDRPVGITLIALPALWGLVATDASLPPFSLFLIFMAGAFLMRSAGCVINDLIDHNLDQQVTRTKQRPLASKELSSLQGWGCMGVLLGLALILLLHLNFETQLLGVIAVVLTSFYPFMKRFTYWPQAFLGLAMNWGILMAETALKGTISLKGILLFLVGIAWTLFYDTLYAHQDKEDDLKIGLKSSALKLGHHTKPFLAGIIILQSLCLITYYLAAYSLSWRFIIFSVLALSSLLYSLWKTNIESPDSCLKAFKQSQFFGWFLLIALV